jgi:hypothetical protein
MHVNRGFYPGKGAKHNLEQGQRGQAEAGELPRGSEDLRGLVKDLGVGEDQASL